MHVVGIDRSVNAGFLARLAVLGGGRCELVESEDRLDEATEHIHRRIAAPLLTQVSLAADGIAGDTVAPRRTSDLFPGVPLVITGRCAELTGVRVTALTADGKEWTCTVPSSAAPPELAGAATEPDQNTPPREPTGPSAVTALWARAHLRDLEDAYAAFPADPKELERQIVATSLRFGVLCRFTAFVAMDERVVTDGGQPHRVIQPVEPASGWEMLAGSAPTERPIAARAMRRTAAVAAGPDQTRAKMARRRGLDRKAQLPLTWTEAGGDLAEDLVRRLGTELTRLRAEDGSAWAVRRVLLADLGTRLSALNDELDRAGLATDAVAELNALVVDLVACETDPPRGEDFEVLWRRVVDILVRLTDDPPGTREQPGQPARKGFWRRG